MISAHCQKKSLAYHDEAFDYALPQDGTYVIQGRARLSGCDDLDGGIVAVTRLNGKFQGRDAVCSFSRNVDELRGEGDIEVAGIGAQAEVDEDIGPLMMQTQRHGASLHRPFCPASDAGSGAGTLSNPAHQWMVISTRVSMEGGQNIHGYRHWSYVVFSARVSALQMGYSMEKCAAESCRAERRRIVESMVGLGSINQVQRESVCA